MNAVEFRKLLVFQGACVEALAWSKGKSLKTVWETCERGDWMLWLTAKMIGKVGWPSHQQVVLAACDCAETALVYVPAGEERPKKCIEVVRKWTRGEATLTEVQQARNAAAAAAAAADAAADAAAAYAAYAAAAYAAAAYADAAAAAADAAYADAYAAAAADAAYADAAAAAADAAYADAYAADAAAAAADAAYADAYAATRSKSLRQSADLVRARLKVPL
jgi:hypothetical protein